MGKINKESESLSFEVCVCVSVRQSVSVWVWARTVCHVANLCIFVLHLI